MWTMSGGPVERGVDCHVMHLHQIWRYLGLLGYALIWILDDALQNSSVDDLAELWQIYSTIIVRS